MLLIALRAVVHTNKNVNPSSLPRVKAPVLAARHLITIDGMGEMKTEAKNIKPKMSMQRSTLLTAFKLSVGRPNDHCNHVNVQPGTQLSRV